jgi:Ca2+/Na+ antiporter
LFLFTLLHGPIQMTPEINELSGELRVLLFLLTIVVFFIFYLGKTVGKIKSFILLGLYVLFLFYVVGRSYNDPISSAIAEFLRAILHFFNSFFY